MLYNAYDADAEYAYGFSNAKPIDWDEEPYTFWNLVNDYGEDYAHNHQEVIIEVMEQSHYFYNAKTNDRMVINKFWSLSHEERVNILYEYFNEDIGYWQKELEKEKDA